MTQYIILYILTIYIVAFQETFNIFELSKAKSFLAYIDNLQIFVVQAVYGFFGEMAIIARNSFFNQTDIGISDIFQLFLPETTFQFFLHNRLFSPCSFMRRGVEDFISLIYVHQHILHAVCFPKVVIFRLRS